MSVTCSELRDSWERQSQDLLLLPSFLLHSFLSTYLCQALEEVLMTSKEHGKTSKISLSSNPFYQPKNLGYYSYFIKEVGSIFIKKKYF